KNSKDGENIQSSARAPRIAHVIGEALSIKVLHHQIRNSLIDKAEVENGDQIRVNQSSAGFGFGLESLEIHFSTSRSFVKGLNCHGAIDESMGSAIHTTHAAFTDCLFNTIMAANYVARLDASDCLCLNSCARHFICVSL